jgi:Lon protease-like protein
MNTSDSFPAQFSGTARLFPLPNLVMFPNVVQPLHVFEPRYRQMTTDALATDRLIAMVLPQPGWEPIYAGKPPVHPVACLGKILADHLLDDGRFNILLRGLTRVRILEEVPTDRLYRVAKVEILQEIPVEDAGREQGWRDCLATRSPLWVPGNTDVAKQLREILVGDLSLGTLSDVLTFALPLEPEFKQTLLEQCDVNRRLEWLCKHLDVQAERRTPPELSAN